MPNGMKQYESNISKNIVKYLNSLPLSHCRKRYAGPFKKGMADVCGTLQGHSIEIEVKVGDNKPTKLQELWLKKAAAAGAITGVAYSVDDVKEILKKHGIKIEI